MISTLRFIFCLVSLIIVGVMYLVDKRGMPWGNLGMGIFILSYIVFEIIVETFLGHWLNLNLYNIIVFSLVAVLSIILGIVFLREGISDIKKWKKNR